MIQRPDTLEAILQAIQGKRILVIGDAMLDNYVWGDASRISPEAPVPVVKVSHETFTAGGAANVALNIAALGGSATLFGWIGDDPSGRRLVEVVRDGGVRVLEGAVSANHETIVKTRIVCRRQQLCRMDREAGPSASPSPPTRSANGSPPRCARRTPSSSPTTARGSSRPNPSAPSRPPHPRECSSPSIRSRARGSRILVSRS